ncbi:MAG: helix-turn-helix transcriptional regulator [Oscillospiraceae bacterium]|nr:helix-turn-helix transcriptional regulator [Oscillospiraceae bacterium]
MDYMDKVNAVSRMQKRIISDLDGVTLDGLSAAAGYSKSHAARMFKEVTGKTPYEYIRALRLTRAAEGLRDSGGKIIDAALDSGFGSHDGFTRAFARQFNITPRRYSRETPPVCYFVHYPIESYYHLKDGEKSMKNEKVSRTVTVTAVERPARKLILLRAKKTAGGDYFAYCEEMGCEWEGLLNSIPEKFAPAALLTLPQNLVAPGTSDTAAGVEVSADYTKPVPDGYDVIGLPPCVMLFFNGAPYENEEDFCVAIGIVGEAIGNYNPEHYGWRAAPELAPRFNFGSSEALGARMAIPVKKL